MIDASVLVPALAFGTLLAVLYFGLLGTKGAQQPDQDKHKSALATRENTPAEGSSGDPSV